MTFANENHTIRGSGSPVLLPRQPQDGTQSRTQAAGATAGHPPGGKAEDAKALSGVYNAGKARKGAVRGGNEKDGL